MHRLSRSTTLRDRRLAIPSTCKRIATAVKEELKLADLKVTFVPLTSADRLDAIVKNKADIECGATTMTLSREEKVDFTLMTFVTGGSLLSLADSNVNALADVAGKSVAVVTGTTSEAALKTALTKNLIDAKVVPVASREEAMKQLDARQVVAFASDQIVLIGQVMRRVLEEMHMPEVTICYGMTETSPVSFQTLTDDPVEKRVTTVGRIHPHVQVKIVDLDGRVTPRGVSGELLTRGYSVMRGYWNEPERTREALDESGWMHTGDLGVLDEEGYCNIVGRVKDMIIRGGENVYPREIEEFLYRHPAILDVAVVGVPDDKYGEAVCACIRLREGATLQAEEIQEFCRAQIAHYKVPRYVRFVDSFPLTVTGKVQKYLIREQLCRELGLQEDVARLRLIQRQAVGLDVEDLHRTRLDFGDVDLLLALRTEGQVGRHRSPRS